jgi:hypothetical protein
VPWEFVGEGLILVEGAIRRQVVAFCGIQLLQAICRFSLRYTFKIVNRRLAAVLLLTLAVSSVGLADETSFHRVSVPTSKGKHVKAVLTFSDNNRAVEVRPAKGDLVTIPYAQIDKCSYQYTTERKVTLTEAKVHWLEIDYHNQDTHKVFVLLMDKHDYLQILSAVKTHLGIDAEVLGNANKRH